MTHSVTHFLALFRAQETSQTQQRSSNQQTNPEKRPLPVVSFLWIRSSLPTLRPGHGLIPLAWH